MNKNFVNFHILISHSPSCLNRDDMNMQKTAIFGGVKRARISSQSLKRTMRTSEYYKQHFGERSIRTLHLYHPDKPNLKEHFCVALAGRFDASLVERVLELLSGKEMNVQVDVEGDAVTPWSVEEVAWYCEQIQKADAQGLDKKALEKHLKQHIEAMRQALGKTLDIALSGRMATSGLMSEIGKVDGALSVAHAITTHAVESDLDWFTAVDDLQELGSGHLNTQEFSSGVFYRYASLNIAQLQENLGGASRERALDIAAHVLHMLATEVPNAKQTSHAAFNLADLALVTFSDVPVSLANAFEEPMRANRGGGLRLPSMRQLNKHWQTVHAAYGLDEVCAEFALESDEVPEGIRREKTLQGLEAWVRCDGKE